MHSLRTQPPRTYLTIMPPVYWRVLRHAAVREQDMLFVEQDLEDVSLTASSQRPVNVVDGTHEDVSPLSPFGARALRVDVLPAVHLLRAAARGTLPSNTTWRRPVLMSGSIVLNDMFGSFPVFFLSFFFLCFVSLFSRSTIGSSVRFQQRSTFSLRYFGA